MAFATFQAPSWFPNPHRCTLGGRAQEDLCSVELNSRVTQNSQEFQTLEMFKGSSWLGLVLDLTAGRFWEKWGPALSAVQEGQVCDSGLGGDPGEGGSRLWQEDPSGLQGLQVPWPELQSGPA